MRRQAFQNGARSAGFLAFLIVSLASAQAQRGGVLVLSGSTNATSYEPLIIPALRHSAFGPDRVPEAAGVANPVGGVDYGSGVGPVPSTPVEETPASVTSSVAGFPISAPLVPAGLENQDLSQAQPPIISPPPPPFGYPPFLGSPAGNVQTPTGSSSTAAFAASPGVATPPPPLPGLPPGLGSAAPGLSTGVGIAGPPPGSPPPFTRAPGGR
jgi:hypothetical protein